MRRRKGRTRQEEEEEAGALGLMLADWVGYDHTTGILFFPLIPLTPQNVRMHMRQRAWCMQVNKMIKRKSGDENRK